MIEAAHTSQISALLVLAHQGDTSARERLVHYAGKRMRAMAHGMLYSNRLRRWQESDDLLQETLVRLNRCLSQAEVSGTQAFLGIAAHEMRRALIDLARHFFGPLGIGTHHQSDHDELDSKPLSVFASPTIDPASAAIEGERWERLYRAIEELADEDRQVVDLIWFCDLSQAEASAVLGIAPRTIARRWRRARLQLYATLHESLPGE